MLEKGCIYYIDYVHDMSITSSSLDLVRLVRELMDVFSTNLSGAPPGKDIDFSF